MNNIDKTLSLAKKIKDKIIKKPPIIICLSGELGAGKTTLVQMILKEIGLSDTVKSPTFIIHSEYFKDPYNISHIDLYRISSHKEFAELKLENVLQKKNVIMFIEWADKFKDEIYKLNTNTIWIDIVQNADESRTIKIS